MVWHCSVGRLALRNFQTTAFSKSRWQTTETFKGSCLRKKEMRCSVKPNFGFYQSFLKSWELMCFEVIPALKMVGASPALTLTLCRNGGTVASKCGQSSCCWKSEDRFSKHLSALMKAYICILYEHTKAHTKVRNMQAVLVGLAIGFPARQGPVNGLVVCCPATVWATLG